MTEPEMASTEQSAASQKHETLIDRIIEGSARNKFLVFVFTIFAVAAGIYGLMHTPLDAIRLLGVEESARVELVHRQRCDQ